MDIPAALASVSTALGIIKQVREIDKDYDTAVLKSQMAELYISLADVRMALSDAKEVIHAKDQEIANLERKVAEATDGDQCPKCKKGRFQLINSVPHPIFGEMGHLERTMKCDNEDCGFSEKHKYDPNA